MLYDIFFSFSENLDFKKFIFEIPNLVIDYCEDFLGSFKIQILRLNTTAQTFLLPKR